MKKLTILTAAAAAMLAVPASAGSLYLSAPTQPAIPFLNGSVNWDTTTSNWGNAATGATYSTWSDLNTAVFPQGNSSVTPTVTLKQNVSTTGLVNTHTANSYDLSLVGDGTMRLLTVNGDITTTLASASRAMKITGTSISIDGTYTKKGNGILNFDSGLAAGTIGGNLTIEAGTVAIGGGDDVKTTGDGLKLNIMGGGTLTLNTNVNPSGTGFKELKGAGGTINGATAHRSFNVAQTTTTTYAGTIAANAGTYYDITKLGTGSLTLSGNNAAMNTSAAAVTTATITAGALIGGSDTAFGTANKSDVSVGASGTIGVANMANLGINNLTLANGATLFFDLSGAVSFTDTQLLVGGNQTGAFNFTVNLANVTTSGTYTLMSVTGTKAATGFTQGTPSGFTWNSLGWVGNNLVADITAIPEPGTIVAAAGLLGLMLWPHRRRLGLTK